LEEVIEVRQASEGFKNVEYQVVPEFIFDFGSGLVSQRFQPSSFFPFNAELLVESVGGTLETVGVGMGGIHPSNGGVNL
ncbi:MAG: hypothetical protein GY940_19275, partial [bacterium]|nr:hypothetical protein [bacterium]